MKREKDRGGLPARLKSFLRVRLREAQRELALSPPAVHEARKAIKKLRAGLRLARKMFAKARLQKIEDPLRRAAHLLGPLRDKEVLKKTVEDLRKRNEQPLPGKVTFPTPPAWRSRARQELESAGSHLDSLVWTEIENQAGWAGLTRLYRRGRKAMRQADSSRTDEDLHTWRKRTKDFLYALELLGTDEIPGGASTLKKTKRLAEYLGDDHDLAFFEAKHARERARKAHQPLFKRAKKRRCHLQKKAFDLGRHVYGKRPEKFG